MLIPAKKLEPEKQTECQQNDWVALDPKTGANLQRSTEELQQKARPALAFLILVTHFNCRKPPYLVK